MIILLSTSKRPALKIPNPIPPTINIYADTYIIHICITCSVMWLQYLHFCIGSPNLQRCQSIRVFLLRRSIFWFANMSKTRHCHFLNKTISDLNCMLLLLYGHAAVNTFVQDLILLHPFYF